MKALRFLLGIFLWIFGAALFLLTLVALLAHSTARLQSIIWPRDFYLIATAVPVVLLVIACFVSGWFLVRRI
jgi:signal transduction histidine kinase